MANENEGVQTQATTTEPTKYLDKKGLETFWGKVKALVTAAVATMTDSIPGIVKPITDPIDDKLTAHINNKNNPHGVTKEQLGLGKLQKDTAYIPASEKGVKDGVATLDANGKIPVEQLGNLDTDLYVIVDELPETEQKTNKIYLKPSGGTEKENNIYTEYGWVNGEWEILGTFSAQVDLAPYAKLDGGNQFTGQQVVYDDETDYIVQIDNLGVTVGDGDNDLTINNRGIKVTNGSDTEVFNTNGGTVQMTDYVAKNIYYHDIEAVTDKLYGKLDKTGGTISGNLAVTGTLTRGGKAVLTDHQAIYSLTVQKNGSSVGTFNPKSANATINVTVPTKLSEFTDDVVKDKYLPLKDGGKVVGSGDSTFYTDITNGAITVGDSDTGGDSILINRNGLTKKQGGTTVGLATEAFATNGATINMTDYATTSAMSTELKKYLPLSGGTVTGDLSVLMANLKVLANPAGAISFMANPTGIRAVKISKINGTATQALMADGSVAERIDETEIDKICV